MIPPISKAPHVPEAITKPKAKTKMSEGRAVQASVPPSGALAQRGVSDDSFAFGAPQATRISVQADKPNQANLDKGARRSA